MDFKDDCDDIIPLRASTLFAVTERRRSMLDSSFIVRCTKSDVFQHMNTYTWSLFIPILGTQDNYLTLTLHSHTAHNEPHTPSCTYSQPTSTMKSASAANDDTGTKALVPQLTEFGITEQDLSTAIRVLDAISSLDPKKRKKKKKKRKASTTNNNSDDKEEEEEEDGLSEYKQPNLRKFRKSLSNTLSLHQQTMYNGQSELQYYENRIAERTLKRQKMAERAQQKKYVATTDLRKGRVEKLERLKEDSKEEEEMKLLQYLVPDGHVDTHTIKEDGDVKMLENGKSTTTTEDTTNKSLKEAETKDEEEGKQLPKLRSCYVCKVRFRTLHHFYDQLCPDCASINYTKRHQTAQLMNKVAVVTGSRVKIGYQVVLKLLRGGCTVVATTRFPNNAVASYKREHDFQVWKGRLHVYGLDLRDITGLEAFTRYLKMQFGECGIDILINNACQTVRRPGGYYLPLVQRESEIWSKGDEAHRDVLKGGIEFERIRRRLVEEHSTDNGQGGNLLPASGTAGGQQSILLNGPSYDSATQGKDGEEKKCEVMVANTRSSSSTSSMTKQTKLSMTP